MTTRPQGFWDSEGAWRSLLCQASRFTGNSFMKCLQNSEVNVIGDSNAKRIYYFLTENSGTSKVFNRSWPEAPFEAKNTAWNFTVKFWPHDYPLFLGEKWQPLLRYGSVEHIIDAIPSSGRQLVILHYFLHMTPFHLSVARSRLEAAAKAIARLVNRNPEARVAFRGPHVASNGWRGVLSVGGDVLGKQYLDIISTAFTGLKDRVVFLDGWEMTTALENPDFHPSNIVAQEMTYTFMSFLCQ
ncbi:NXPE family member 3 [Elysia marginata]|uniref:NXPE family member 3 n=1 Tax=Elysia marginata TaxID=1093978 RepID=A0AAV4HSP8_9GAST|nr:NXPE family member 3 [Elysia marginata]